MDPKPARPSSRLLRYGLIGLSLLGWGLAARMLVIGVLATLADPASGAGGIGVDTYAYWLAGSDLLDGASPYDAAAIDELGAYFYPPPLAQAWMPLSLVDPAISDWLWRIFSLLCIRYMAGSWVMSGVWMLYPGTITELAAGNVTFQVAALTVAGLRGHAGAIGVATVLKLGAVMVAPFLWFCRPQLRRGLVAGFVAAAAVVLVSALVAPGAWVDYLESGREQASMTLAGTDILHVLPNASENYALQVAVALIIAGLSVWRRSPHLAYLASVIAVPTLWPQRLSVLFALLTLEDDGWVQRVLHRRAREDEGSDAPPGAVPDSATA